MLIIHLESGELFDASTSKIIRVPERTLRLEHSLLSISKWESKWEIPFLSEERKTQEQLFDYVSMMSEEVIDEVTLKRLSQENFVKLNEYLNAKHSATTFNDASNKKNSRQVVTSEMIYYWMTAYNIPFTCETWPIARLMNLIRIASIKNNAEKPKKTNRSQALADRAALNAKRRAELGSRG